jgi:hypothetical protein
MQRLKLYPTADGAHLQVFLQVKKPLVPIDPNRNIELHPALTLTFLSVKTKQYQ